MRFFKEEDEQRFLWVPVLLGCGIGLYFYVPTEPPLWLGILAFSFCIGLSFLTLQRGNFFFTPLIFALVFLGFLVATIHSWFATAPVWSGSSRPVLLHGVVLDVEKQTIGNRIILSSLSFADKQHDEELPQKIRLTIRGEEKTITPGDHVRLKAVMMPPPAPAAPYSYDFARQAWFMKLGAVGYVVGSVEKIDDKERKTWKEKFLFSYAAFRNSLKDRIYKESPIASAPIAVTLMTGGTGNVPSDLLKAYRDSGLAHLLSISGLHMSLVAGVVFIVIRRGLALFPTIALRYPIKKWAALISLPITLFYLLIAGAPVPTIRAFIMITLVLLAVLTDRTAISLRLIAWAAIIVLLWQPESLLGASFQMSFGAVVALIAFYQENTRRLTKTNNRRWSGHIIYYISGIVVTTLIAGGVTSVYGIYHFNRFSLYSIVANIIAIPVTGFWIMPWAIIAFCLMPLGWENWALHCMGWGIDILNLTALKIASWPYASLPTPPLSVEAVALFTFGGVWLCCWRQPWRWWGIGAMAGALLSLAWSAPPSFLIAKDGALMAARSGQGELFIFPSVRPVSMQKETWIARNGGQTAQSWPKAGQEQPGDHLVCDSQGCIYQEKGRVLALIRDPAILSEECERNDIVVSLSSVSRSKRQQCTAQIIDRFDLGREGTYAVWLKDKKIVSTREWQGDRPWSIRKQTYTPVSKKPGDQ